MAGYRVGQTPINTQFIPSVRHNVQRKAPPLELVKINYKEAIFPNCNKAGIDVVIRDNRGSVLASCSKILPRAYCGEEIKALAGAFALSFALDIGFSRVVLEVDSCTVFIALKGDDFSLALFGLLIEDAKFEAKKFEQLFDSHTNRDGNVITHSLIRYAISIPDFLV